MGKGELTDSFFLIIIVFMKTLLSFYNLHKKTCYLTAGLILACLFMAPFFLLGTDSIVTYHDQLDGELFNYILAARYLFTDIRIYPEIMNGLPVQGAVPPAPFFVLFYRFFQPFTAFMLSQWFIYLTAFSGMYLLLLKLTGREFISFGISVIFMLLPFYPVYGLCIPGQPLLCCAVLSLWQRETVYSSDSGGKPGSRKSGALLYYVLIIFYGISSSLVLVGFACLLALGFFAGITGISALHRKKKLPLSPWYASFVLGITYIVTNFSLIKQVLFPETAYVSHKTELTVSPKETLPYLKEVFGTGVSYAHSYHTVLFFLAAFCVLLSFLHIVMKIMGKATPAKSVYQTGKNQPDFLCNKEEPSALKHHFVKAVWVLLFISVIGLFAVFYHGNDMAKLRNASDGILKTFNLDRVCWLLPTAWCILAAYLLTFIAALPWKGYLKQGITFLVLGIWGLTVLSHSALYPNLAKLMKSGDYHALDWHSFFCEDIFSQIDEAIGKPKESYRVISIGIYPAAAAYNGFYCLDGYSNNYPLAYKHIFRHIIDGELEKNDYIRTLFDEWGNRCYITTAEQADYYTFEKRWNSVIYDLDLDADVLRELNCQYVFSAAYLMNAEENGLSLLQDAPFETEGSWYHIYVYVVV